MSFGLFSLTGVLAGIAALAIGLWLAQRLRVQYREVEVPTTLFWRDAVEETRARVFMRRFRHWRAWGLLVLIASLLWLLLNQPQNVSWDGTRHIVLLDWSVEDPQLRQRDLSLALQLAAGLPEADREILAVGTRLETLLQPREPLVLAQQRSQTAARPGAAGMDWAIESLAARAGDRSPLAIHVVGDAPIDQTRIQALRTALSATDARNNGSPVQPLSLSVYRVKRASLASQVDTATGDLATLGVSDSASGTWNQVDIWIAMADPQKAQTRNLSVSLDRRPLRQKLMARGNGMFEIQALPADGGLLEVAYAGRTVGAMTLPVRDRIRVQIESDVPQSLRQLVELDSACQIVPDPDSADVVIGSKPEANLRLTTRAQPAFLIQTENENPQQVLSGIVDELALRQIDAMGIAFESGRVVDVQMVSGSRRSLSVWRSLFTAEFDFQESRACPIVVGRALRWLARRPPLVEWAELGKRLPAAAPEFDRASDGIALTNDGRQIRTTRIRPHSKSTPSKPTLPESPRMLTASGFHPLHGLGVLLVLLLIGEWILFQRGYVP